MFTMKKPKYDVLSCGKWLRCTKAQEQPNGWLHYELADGTIGLQRPGTWKVVKRLN